MSSENSTINDTSSEEYKIDKLKNFILYSKYYSDILYSLASKPDVTIRFNPMDCKDDIEIVNIFNEVPEDFPILVKSAFVDLSEIWHRERVRLHTKIEISDATQIKLHQWGAKFEGVPVAVDCQVIGVNKQETYTRFAEAYCESCSERLQMFTLGKPPKCPNEDCEKHNKLMTFDKSTLKTGDIRTVIIQEPIEESRNGTPVSFDCLLKDDYALQTHIGQRIRLIGTFRSYPQKDKVTNQVLINAISLYPLDEVKELQPTDPQIEYFKSLRQRPDYLKIVPQSIAPEIIHEDLAKLCVLISLVGAPDVDRIIGMIHALLIGNPAQGKSMILEYILLLVRKSAMAVGGTMSGSGITVTMDTLPNRQRMPRAGIVPLCSRGVAVVDEINQTQEEDQGKLHQCMASGWINYNKGGFDLTLEAMTTIIAGANPKYYLYDTSKSIVDNINLTPPLISRFDFIVNMSKKKTALERQQIIQHMNLVRRIGVNAYIRQAGLLVPEDLAAFISYCKTFNPVFTEKAEQLATDFQLRIEALEQKDGSLPIDNRFYNTVQKISLAIARLYFSNEVTPDHVMFAIEIIKKTLLTFDMNVEAGQMQQDLISGKKMQEDEFDTVCHVLQKKNEDGRFTENEFCNTAVDIYPKKFPYYGKAEKFFEKMKEQLKDKVNGRYKLD